MRVSLLIGFALTVCLKVAVLWVLASAATSGLKAGLKDCGKTYGIEKVLDGNWFCAEK